MGDRRAAVGWAFVAAALASCATPRTAPIIEGRPTSDRAAARCLPPAASPWMDYVLARLGDELLLCDGVGRVHGACWRLDPATGAVRADPRATVPGLAFAVDGRCVDGMCARGDAPEADDSSTWFVFHPDGARAAMLHGLEVTLFDVAHKRPIGRFPLRGDTVGDHQLSNAAVNLWFIGDTIYVRGDDAGPASYLFRYDTDGAAREVIGNLYHGGVAVDGDGLTVALDGASAIHTIDRHDRMASRWRPVPGGPCHGGDIPEWQDLGDEAGECEAHLARHFVPYDGAQVVTVGGALVGVTATEVFWLDATTLAETRRVPLRRCDVDGATGDAATPAP